MIDALVAALRPFADQLTSDESLCHKGLTTAAKCSRCGPILRARLVIAMADTRLDGHQIRKGTNDVLKDLAYAQRYMDEFCESDFPGRRIALEMRFVERALRVAAAEIKQLRSQLRSRAAQKGQAL